MKDELDCVFSVAGRQDMTCLIRAVADHNPRVDIGAD
jgi:hypothetical protein